MDKYEVDAREAVRRLQVLAADHEQLQLLLFAAWELACWLSWLQVASGSDKPINNPFALRAVRDELAWEVLERERQNGED